MPDRFIWHTHNELETPWQFYVMNTKYLESPIRGKWQISEAATNAAEQASADLRQDEEHWTHSLLSLANVGMVQSSDLRPYELGRRSARAAHVENLAVFTHEWVFESKWRDESWTTAWEDRLRSEHSDLTCAFEGLCQERNWATFEQDFLAKKKLGYVPHRLRDIPREIGTLQELDKLASLMRAGVFPSSSPDPAIAGFLTELYRHLWLHSWNPAPAQAGAA